jgi:hypothetical protein
MSITLSEIVTASRQNEAAIELTRQRESNEAHERTMDDFREWVSNNPCFTDDEKAAIRMASREW